jgi:prephenate dehydrogenase
MPETFPFRRIAVIGTGLIGGSFGLAVRKYFPEIEINGWDRDAASLSGALSRGAIQSAAPGLSTAIKGADLVYIALPVSAIAKALSPIAASAPAQALVTDAGSTKVLIARAAKECFKDDARFLGGHPMAGKENSGIDHAEPEMFRGAPYALIANKTTAPAAVKAFAKLVTAIGAQPVWCDAETHDWSVSVVSHLPQLLAIALAQVVNDETDETGFPLALAGQGLQDSLRLAGSPYSVWRDILVSNSDNAGHALNRLGQAIEHLQQNLRSPELEAEFRAANELHKKLRK